MRVKYLGPNADLLEIGEETVNNAEQQRQQTKRRDLTSRYIGVCYDKLMKKWIACLQVKGKLHRKVCATELEAASNVNKMRLELIGPNADLLEIDEE